MKISKALLLIILTIFALSCKNNKQSDTKQDTALVFEERIFNMESSTCATDSVRCARVFITYPVATQGDAAALSAINDSVMFYIRQTVSVFAGSPESIPATLEEAAAGFIGEYEVYQQEQTDFITPWEIETNGKVLHQSPEVVSLEIDNYSYAGGAHPNGYSILLNFDAKTGAKIDPVEKVTDVKKLTQLAEAKFREARELEADADLNEEGFFWGGPFALPANIAITDKGLYFVYNAYEAAAYALGPTDFVLTYEELKDIWKK